MSEFGGNLDGQGVVGDPLLNAAVRVDQFQIEIDALSYFYTAAAYRSLVKGIRIRNIGWTGDSEEMVVTVRTEAVGTRSLIHPIARAYPIPAINDFPIDFDVLKLRPNLTELADIDESVVGSILVQIHIEDQLVAEQRKTVEFLAYNQWLHSPLDYETLSAFVLPNHPAISKVMEGVRTRMGKIAGSTATAGYQLYSRSPEAGYAHVEHILTAIFEELQSLGLNYTNPPASFEGFGQKIRTPDVVISERAATCIDSTVFAASCIAAAGLSPLLFLVEGHAFPGVWMVPASAPTGVVTNPNEWQDFVAKGVIGSFESTLICQPSATYQTARNRHADFSTGSGVEEFEAFIDVESSSQLGVRRLPNRTKNSKGEVIEVEVDRSAIESLKPVEYQPVQLDFADDADRTKLNVANVPPRVRRWMDALLDISNTNPLIHLAAVPAFFPAKERRSTRSIELPMVPGLLAEVENALFDKGSIRAVCAHRVPGSVLNNPTDSVVVEYFKAESTLSIGPISAYMNEIEGGYESFVQQGAPPQAARLRATDIAEKLHEAEVTRRFRALKKLADDTEASSATNQLYMTIGSLVWDSPGEGGKGSKTVKSPMFVLPIRISGTASTSFTIRLDEGGEISPNYCLLEKLRAEIGLRIPELENPNLDESGIDVTDTIARIRRQLSDSKFASIRVEEDCQLAVLDFATFRMWKDIRNNWELFAKNPVVNHLIHGSNATLQQDLPPFEGEVLTPFDCDESQAEAVRWALEGRSFVLEGPPGTGKSQTIANLIAASMAEGKRVLFVAEKMVALEGVAEKLNDIGLAPFCITMHHDDTTPESIRKQLRTSLEFVSDDVTARWASETAVSKSLRDRLVQYREELVSQNTVGETALSAQQNVLRLGDGDALDIPVASLEAIGHNLDDIRSALLEIRTVVGASRVSPDSTWAIAGLANPEAINKDLLASLITEVSTAMSNVEHLKELAAPILDSDTPLPNGAVAAIKAIVEGRGLSLTQAQEIVDAGWMASIQLISRQIASHTKEHKAVFEFFKADAFAMDLSIQMQAAREAMEANFFSRKKKTEQLHALLAPVARWPISQEPAELLTLLQRVAPAKEGVQEVKDQYRALKHIELRSDFDPLNSEHIIGLSEDAHELVRRAEVMVGRDTEVVHSLVAKGISFRSGDLDAIQKLLDVWKLLHQLLGATPETLRAWKSVHSTWDALVLHLPLWREETPQFPRLMQSARVNRTLAPLRVAGLTALVESITDGTQSLDDIYSEFERGMAKAALRERLSQSSLVNFDRESFERTVADFTRRDRNRKDLMKSMIPHGLSQSRPFKPGIRTGEIGNLEKELTKKVRRVSVPGLIKSYGEMITRLTPCFLMSPEAVSRLLPADSQFFDIVVFDEASQIRVAAAIPAMGRGKSVVVVGDSKQMPPSKKIGKKSTSTESDSGVDDDGGLLDLESILTECSESHLPSLMLKCHFRSQHEGLIAFSNRNFYDNNLVTFPAPDIEKSTPVQWFPVVDGQFERSGDAKGTNPAEVRDVVAEIQRRLNDPEHAGKTIGVVTFNEPQAEAIGSRLTELAASDPAVMAALSLPLKKRLFVVPLEQVQGDERDTIILSVSYSYQGTDRTKVSPTWGPLTNKGGERRLNVAITRAKKELLVFCSFDPNHVKTDSSTHDGVPYTVAFLKECRDIGMSGGAAFRSRDSIGKDFQRRRLFDQLRAEGIQVRENVGLSRFRIDLAISDDTGHQFLALLLDSDEWASRTTPYDREVLPNSVMRLIGWRRVGRVWLKTVVDDPSYVIERVRYELKREKQRLALIEMLKERGYEVRSDSSLSQFGIDLAVRKTGTAKWPLAISMNGPGGFQQFLPFEGELPPEHILRSVNCVQSMAVWLPDFEGNEENILSRIDSFYANAMLDIENEPDVVIAQPKTVAEMAAAQALVGDDEAAQLRQSEYWSEFFDAKTLPILGEQSILGPGAGYNPNTVRRAIDEVVLREGPILESRLASVVASRFNMTKVTASRLATFRKAFAHLTKTETPFGVVYWPLERSADSWNGFRTSSGEQTRQIDDVPAEEIANAMIAVVRMGGSAYEEQVVRLVAKAYGRKAVTAVLAERLNAILQWTIANGRIVNDAGLLKLN